MPRPLKTRFVYMNDIPRAFSPVGITRKELEEVRITMDELEAIRFADLEGVYQEEAARLMGISRQTFGRLLICARKKIAECIVNGKVLKVERRGCAVEGRFSVCKNCREVWLMQKEPYLACPDCGGNLMDISRIEGHFPCRWRRKLFWRLENDDGGEAMRWRHRNRNGFGGMGPDGYCICPKCSFRKPHTMGVPCREERCPECGSPMVREGSYHHQRIEEKKKGGD